ncbi:MAG: hypothetical protein ACLTKG_05715 [Collinsella intestinalis]
MAELLEAIMLICFGLSWPLNAYKNYRAGTAVGTSWQFIALITAGYFAGIAAKFVSGNLNWVLIVYFINVVCIAANWLVYFRNRRLDSLSRVVMEVFRRGGLASLSLYLVEASRIPKRHSLPLDAEVRAR